MADHNHDEQYLGLSTHDLIKHESVHIGTAVIKTAHIADAQITTAKIVNLAVTTAKIDNLAVTDAKIDTLTATKITAGTIGAHTINLNGATSIIQSSNFVAGSAGWRVKGDGAAEFGDTIMRGQFATAASGNRIEIKTVSGSGHIRIFAGSGSEVNPGQLFTSSSAPEMELRSPEWSGGSDDYSYFRLAGDSGTDNGLAQVTASTGLTVTCNSSSWTGAALTVAVSSADAKAAEFVNSANSRTTLIDEKGRIRLPDSNQAMVVNEFDPFTSGGHGPIGRWGMFMESNTLVLGIPNTSGKFFAVSNYAADATRDDIILSDAGGETWIRPGNAGLDVAEVVGGGLLAETRTETRTTSGFKRHTANDHFNTSDRSLKRNVRVAATTGHLAKLKAAPAHNYRLVGDEEFDPAERIGPMAEDMPAEVKGWTNLNGRRIEVVSTQAQIGFLWAAMQEIVDRLETVEARPGRP